MMHKVLFILTVVLSTNSIAQDEFKRNMYKGNLFTDEKDYEEALYYFKKAVDESPLNYKANFNVANTHFQMKEYEKAAELFSDISGLAPSGFDESKVYHNLGNSFFMDKKLDEAIEAYKKSLRLNPADEATRYNLAYAQLLKKEQEEQNQNENQNQNQNQNGGDQENDENGDQENDENGNQDQDQDQDEQEGDQDKKNNPDGNNEEENEDDKKQNERDPNGNDGEDNPMNKQQSNSPSAISKEQARRILEAAYKREKDVQEDLEKRKIVGSGKSKKKDW